MRAKILLSVFIIGHVYFCRTPETKKSTKPTETSLPLTHQGYASWYGKELHGKPTASGEIFDMNKMTAAHRDFPMGSLVLVKNLENGRKALVTINDRGPYVEGRIIDVSYAAAKELGFAEKGIARVEIELLQEGQDNFMAKANPQDNFQGNFNANSPNKSKSLLPEEEVWEDDAEILSEDEAIAIHKPTPKSSHFIFLNGQKPKGYTIQIGAFKTRANAERHRDDMKARFQKPCFVAQKDQWYYVFIGDFKDSKKAREYLQKLRQEGVDVMYRGKVS